MSEEKKEEDTKATDTKAENTETSETEKPVESSKEKKEKKTTKPKKKSSKSGMTATELAALADAEASTALARSKAAKEAAEKALDEEYKEAAKEAVVAKVSDSFTNKRFQEQIFRREMGEPEFFLRKHELAPPRPILTPEEEAEISRQVEIPIDHTPKYNPEHMLSPEYQGISNYETGVASFKDELEEKLARLQKDPNASQQELRQAEEDLKTVDYLFENYNLGMNVFRTAKGGRNKLEK
jgi:colicin import membrane protein